MKAARGTSRNLSSNLSTSTMKIELTYNDIYLMIVREKEKCERYERALEDVASVHNGLNHDEARWLARDVLEEFKD